MEADYVIVGGGTAGAVLANRLSEDRGVSVLVLEAGGSDWHPFIRMPMGFLKSIQIPDLTWGYQSEPEPHLNGRQVPLPRGHVLGGTSSINGMLHIRGHAAGYDEWRALGCEGWGYADLLPYFKRFEQNWRGESAYHGGSGPVEVQPIDTRHLVFEPLRDAAIAAGIGYTEDYDGAVPQGLARGEVTIDRRGRRHSTARAFLRPAMRRSNLRVLTRALTHRVLFEGRRAVGVEYSHKGETRTVRARREVILAGGTYNSPQMLLRSGVGPAEDLRALGIAPVHDLPGVGKNLMEHPRFVVRFAATKPVSFVNQLRFDKAVLSVLRWAVFGNGPFATQINNAIVLLRTQPDLVRPDIQLLCSPVALEADLWFPGIKAPAEHFFSASVCLLAERSRGQVSLVSADPKVAPRIQLNLLADAEDLAAMRRGVRAARALFRTEPQAGLTGEEVLPGAGIDSDEALDAALRAQTNITHHPVGTCKMGIDDMAVVDPALRVHGLEGLRVIDASVMPMIPGANTMAPTIMIGEKGADLIRGRTLAPEYPA